MRKIVGSDKQVTCGAVPFIGCWQPCESALGLPSFNVVKITLHVTLCGIHDETQILTPNYKVG